MKGSDIILSILKDGKWWNVTDIMKVGKPGALNWAVRSRISDLRKQGYRIDGVRDTNGCRAYRLLGLHD